MKGRGRRSGLAAERCRLSAPAPREPGAPTRLDGPVRTGASICLDPHHHHVVRIASRIPIPILPIVCNPDQKVGRGTHSALPAARSPSEP